MNGTTPHFIKAIFRLRGRQVMRILREGGLSLWLMLPVIVAVLLFTIVSTTEDSPLKLNAGLVFFLFFIHISRNDKTFLFLFRRQGIWLCVAEYAVLTLLVNSYALAKDWHNLKYLAIEATLIIAFALWPANVRRRSLLPKVRPGKAILGLLPRQLYEVRSGLRPLFLGLLLIWVATLWACMHVPIIPFVMPLFLLPLMTAWGMPEPVAITQAQNSFGNVIWKKAGRNALFFLLLFSPHLLLTFSYLPARIELVVGVLVSLGVCLLVMFFAILLKYSRPPVAGPMPFVDQILLMAFACTIPVFPVTIYLLLKQYSKAQWQLQRYFR